MGHFYCDHFIFELLEIGRGEAAALGHSSFFKKYERKNLELFTWSWENFFDNFCQINVEFIKNNLFCFFISLNDIVSNNLLFYSRKTNKKIYNRAKELYCDATIFFLILYCSLVWSKMETEQWPKAADSPLYFQHSREYCKKMSGIFSIFHCNSNIVATFLLNVAKYFIALLQFQISEIFFETNKVINTFRSIVERYPWNVPILHTWIIFRNVANISKILLKFFI